MAKAPANSKACRRNVELNMNSSLVRKTSDRRRVEIRAERAPDLPISAIFQAARNGAKSIRWPSGDRRKAGFPALPQVQPPNRAKAKGDRPGRGRGRRRSAQKLGSGSRRSRSHAARSWRKAPEDKPCPETR